MNYEVESVLEEGLAALGLTLSEQACGKLLDYVQLLARWNRTYNLTAVRDPVAMVTRHILDCLSLLPFLGDAQRIVDVGTGAGLPGLPLAVVRPDTDVVLVECNRKKVCFLKQVSSDCRVKNIQVVNQRVEDYKVEPGFDKLVVRAFASLSDIVDRAGHLLKPGGQILAMKGVCPEVELAVLTQSYTVHPVQVPGMDEQRHIVEIQM